MRPTIAALTLLGLGPAALHAETFSADVWADNWFELRIDGVQVAEDSVPITTERSFNAESFAFEATRAFVVGVVAVNFEADDAGLRYIGTPRQQMGDGGAILQIRDAAGATVAVSDAGWQCLVIHTAPLDEACEDAADPVAGEGACGFEASAEPEGWDAAGFDASDWPQADTYTETEVSPRMGYDEIAWAPEAELIWGPDLEQSNTVLCRLTIE